MANNDNPANIPDPSPQAKNVGEIIHRLEGANLLLFGIALLAVGGGTALGLAGVFTSNPQLYWGVLGILMGVVIAAVIIVRSESARPATDKLVEDRGFDIELSAIRRCVDTALAKAHPRFRAEMIEELREIRKRVSHWKDGEFRIRGGNYNRVLLELYETTRNPVFSVMSLGQLEVWDRTIGPRIATAISDHNVKATRVFFFETRGDITEAHKSMIADQMTHFSETRIYINDEDFTSENDENTEHDFHVFDRGEVLFITDDADADVFAGTLWFNDHDRVGSYERAKQLYIKESKLPREVFGNDFAPPTPLPANLITKGIFPNSEVTNVQVEIKHEFGVAANAPGEGAG